MSTINTTISWQGNKHDRSLWLKVFTGLIELKTLRKICEEDDELPSLITVARWAMDDEMPEYQEGYRLARVIAAELRVDEIFEIARDASNDWEEVYDEEGNSTKRLNAFPIQRAKLLIDTIKWYASRMMPKIYGDRLGVEIGPTSELAKLILQAADTSRGLPAPSDDSDSDSARVH